MPPTRYPGCHSKCPHYQADIDRYYIAKAEEARQLQEKDDYLSARKFKTRRMQDLKK
nr:MAG TPA: hypothetical protein [Caudoviricetes sp.]